LAFGQSPETPQDTTAQTIILSSREYILSIAVLIFGLIIVFCEVFLATKNHGNIEEILKLIVITIIIVSGLFIITAGLSTNQVAPAFGLYGAITGYLLGKESKTKE
jgi:heme/copper-type cytochrome/quinol oxidase subunit 2